MVFTLDRLPHIFLNDFHVHTCYSICAIDKLNAQPRRIINYAQKLGMKSIGFTDHFAQYPPFATEKWKNCGPDIIYSLRNDISNITTQLDVLIGCEADVINGEIISIDHSFAQELDYIIISASHFHLPGVYKPKSTSATSIANHYVDALLFALSFDFVSIIAHPFLTPWHVFGTPSEYLSKISDKEFESIAFMAEKQQIAIEINAHLSRDPDYLYSITRFINICKELGVRFSYGSDAHIYYDIGFHPGMDQVICSLDLEPKDFLMPSDLLRER